jgi:hypothetical protein
MGASGDRRIACRLGVTDISRVDRPGSERLAGDGAPLTWTTTHAADVVRRQYEHRRRVPRFRVLGWAGFSGVVSQNAHYPHDPFAPPSGFQPAVNALPEKKIWSVMERMRTLDGCHFFMARRPEQLKTSYAIDFSTP